MRSYLTEKGYLEALEQENLEPSIIAKALAAIRLGNTLEELYSPKGFNSKFLLCKELFQTTLESSGSIESYINSIRRLYDQLKAKGIELPKQVIITWTLNNLNDDYDSFITSISQSLRSNEDAFTLETLFANILDESRKYNTKETALYSSSSRKFGSSSKATKQKTKSPKRLNKKGPKDTPKYCSYYKKEGHLEDDCYNSGASRHIKANLISRKSEAFSCFKDFKLRTENSDSNSSNKRPRLKILKSDNAKELVSSKVETLLQNSGVKHELSSPYNPEQNGLIERPNRTLLGKVRALLLESGLPKTFWGEALEAAIFLYNRTPHSSLGFKSPYELRYNKPPNLDNIRIFGSISYYTRVKAKKLDTRAKKAILIGYSDSNIYKLYDLESRRVVWARDVTILEGQYYKPSKNREETPLESTVSLGNSRVSSDPVQASSSSKNQISLDTPNNLLDSSSRNDDSRSTSISSNTLEGDELVDDLETVSKTPKTTLGDITSSRPTRTLEDDGLDDELSLYALIASNNSDDPTSYTF
ncbi:unnamed protein product [Cercospora beticola]|nr:unnamed protein product [Cercospora beticola]